MVLSKRERYALIGALLALGALTLDRVVLGPWLTRRSARAAQTARFAADLVRARSQISHGRQSGPKWREMVAAGLKADPAEAESQVLHAIRDWAEESGLSLSLLKPDRLTEKSRLPGIAFQASGAGNMKGVTRLLWRIQTAAIPIKVTELQINARKEGADDLTFQFRLSTVYAAENRDSRLFPAGNRRLSLFSGEP